MKKTTFVISILIIIIALLSICSCKTTEHYTNTNILILDSFSFPREYLDTFNSNDYIARRIVDPKKTLVTYQNSIKRLDLKTNSLQTGMVVVLSDYLVIHEFLLTLVYLELVSLRNLVVQQNPVLLQ